LPRRSPSSAGEAGPALRSLDGGGSAVPASCVLREALFFFCPCPGGTFGNSPAFQRRDPGALPSSPEGTAEIKPKSGHLQPKNELRFPIPDATQFPLNAPVPSLNPSPRRSLQAKAGQLTLSQLPPTALPRAAKRYQAKSRRKYFISEDGKNIPFIGKSSKNALKKHAKKSP
jgi:hypothetical protein